MPVLDFNRIPSPAGSLPVAPRPLKAFKDQTPFTNTTHSSFFPAFRQGFSTGPCLPSLLFCDLPPATLDSSATSSSTCNLKQASPGTYIFIYLSTHPVIRSTISL